MQAKTTARLDPSGGGVDPITADLPGWTKVSGEPTMKTFVQHTSADVSMISGFWEATPGTYRAEYKGFEFVHLLAGHIIITPDGGEPVEMTTGCAFVVEPGFSGTWRSESQCASTLPRTSLKEGDVRSLSHLAADGTGEGCAQR